MKTLANLADRIAVRVRIECLTASETSQWGSMTVGQMVCHCTDAYRYALGERAASPVRPPMPPSLLKWLGLRLPMHWPKSVPTVPEMNQATGAGTPPAEFAADRAALLETFDRFLEKHGDWPPHPIFGAMSHKDWMRWGFLHMDHHLRQFGR